MASVRIRKLAVAMAATAALLTSACVSSDDDAETSTQSSVAPPDSSPDDSVVDDTPRELVLGRGVTEDTIKVGFTFLDFQQLVDLGFSPNTWGDQQLATQALIDDLNAKGGINNRMIEPVYKLYNPIGDEEANAACLELTEDTEVFAVLGGFLGPAEVANTCITKNTVLVGGTQSAERLADSNAPWLMDRAIRSRAIGILFDLLDAAGDLQGKRIALVTGSQGIQEEQTVIDKLAEFDIEPVATLVNDALSGDNVAEDTAWSAIAERVRESEADVVILLGNTSGGIRNIGAQGLDVETWVVDQEELTSLGASVDLEDARGAITAVGLTGQELFEDETVQGPCIEVFTAAHPDIRVVGPDDLEDGEDAWHQGITANCRFLRLFVEVATAAGEELNQETFLRAANEIGDFVAPGQPFASFGPGKYDANDSFRLAVFDPDAGPNGGLTPLGPIQDTTP